MPGRGRSYPAEFKAALEQLPGGEVRDPLLEGATLFSATLRLRQKERLPGRAAASTERMNPL